MGQSEVRVSNNVTIYATGEVVGFVFSVPKNYVSLVLLHINHLHCFFCLKHYNLIFKAQIVILKMISFGFVRGGGSSVYKSFIVC